MAQMPMPEQITLRDYFKQVDTNKSGQITATELRQALTNGQWQGDFNPETVKLMIRMFDKDHSGYISFDEFTSLWKYIMEWENCFRTYDRDNSLSIDKGELAKALKTFGYQFADGTIKTILAKFARPGQDKFLLDDFIRCCVQLHTMKEAFNIRDRNLDGLLTMKFDQFVQMVYSINI